MTAGFVPRLATILVVGLLLTAARVYALGSSVERAIDEAERAVRQGRLGEAERLLDGAVKQAEALGPENPLLARAADARARETRPGMAPSR